MEIWRKEMCFTLGEGWWQHVPGRGGRAQQAHHHVKPCMFPGPNYWSNCTLLSSNSDLGTTISQVPFVTRVWFSGTSTHTRACLWEQDLASLQSLVRQGTVKRPSELYSQTVESMGLAGVSWEPGGGMTAPLKQVGSRPPTSTRTTCFYLFEESIPLLHNCLENTVPRIYLRLNIGTHHKSVTDFWSRNSERGKPSEGLYRSVW